MVLSVRLGHAVAALLALVVLAGAAHVVEPKLAFRDVLVADCTHLGFFFSFHIVQFGGKLFL